MPLLSDPRVALVKLRKVGDSVVVSIPVKILNLMSDAHINDPILLRMNEDGRTIHMIHKPRIWRLLREPRKDAGWLGRKPAGESDEKEELG